MKKEHNPGSKYCSNWMFTNTIAVCKCQNIKSTFQSQQSNKKLKIYWMV